ncbi:MAG: hypothetical protein ACE5OP_12615, partial [Candidatus Glassbacteria bacterium]
LRPVPNPPDSQNEHSPDPGKCGGFFYYLLPFSREGNNISFWRIKLSHEVGGIEFEFLEGTKRRVTTTI